MRVIKRHSDFLFGGTKLLLLSAFLVLAACANPFAGAGGGAKASGSLALSICAGSAVPGARTILPGAADLPAIATVDITLTSGGTTRTATFTPVLGAFTGTVSGLEPGAWGISAIGRAAGSGGAIGPVVATASDTVTIALPGPTTKTLSLAYVPAAPGAMGEFCITLSFPTSIGIDGSTVTIDGNPPSTAPAVVNKSDGTNSTLAIAATGVASPSPIVRVWLKNGTSVLLAWTERVWVYQNVTTTYGEAIDASSFSAKPPAPASLTASLRQDCTVALSWPHVSIAESYSLERSENAGADYTVLSSTVTAGTTSYLDTPPSTLVAKTYKYRISATNAFGTSAYTIDAADVTIDPAVIVADDKAALEIVFAGTDIATAITGNLSLPATGANGSTIFWASSAPAVVTTLGVVSRPAYTAGDMSVTLTATISKGGTSATKSFTITVKKIAQTDAEAVADDKAVLDIGYGGSDSAGSVTQNLTLPTAGSSATTVAWDSSAPAVVTTAGAVTRPANIAGDASVTLTATIGKNAASGTKSFTITVKKIALTAAEAAAAAVAADKAALEIGYGGSDSAGSVTQNLTLPTAGSSATTVAWASSAPAVVTTLGAVTRPAYTASDASVTLTATISKPLASSSTKSFTITVKRIAATDADALSDDKTALALVYSSGDSSASVTANLGLPTSGSSGTTIGWTSSNAGVVSTTGLVIAQAADSAVTLTATLRKNLASDTRAFVLTVKANADKAAIAAAKAVLAISYQSGDSAGSVTGSLSLPTAGTGSTAVAWLSSNSSAITSRGVVTRDVTDRSITLTATISRNGYSDSIAFPVTVKKDQNLIDARADIAAATLGYGGSDVATSVTLDVTPSPATGSTGTNGSAISWTSSKGAVVSAAGAVTRQTTDTSVVLTATATKGGASATKSFTLTVIQAKLVISVTLGAPPQVIFTGAGTTMAKGATWHLATSFAGAGAYSWTIDGAQVGTASTYDIVANNLQIGTHNLTLETTKGGLVYSGGLSFSVTQ